MKEEMVVLLKLRDGRPQAALAVGPFKDGAAEAHRVWSEHPGTCGFTVVPYEGK